MLRSIRYSAIGAPLAATLCVSMGLYGCHKDVADEEELDETGSLSSTYTISTTASDGTSVRYELAPDPIGLSGWSTVTNPDGTQQVEWVTVPNMDQGFTLEMVQDPDGSRWLQDPATGERLEVRNFAEGPEGVSFQVLLADSAPVDVTIGGEVPLAGPIVIGAAALAAIIAGGALIICGLALTLSMINCSRLGHCWEFTFAGGNLKAKIVAACSGKCTDWKQEN